MQSPKSTSKMLVRPSQSVLLSAIVWPLWVRIRWCHADGEKNYMPAKTADRQAIKVNVMRPGTTTFDPCIANF